MRYSSAVGRRQRKNTGITILLCAILVIALIFAITSGAFDGVFQWIMKGYNGLLGEKGVLDKLPESKPEIKGEVVDPQTGDDVQRTIELEAKTYYLIQLGAFTDEQNAKTLAETLKKEGGAGYIYNDGHHRVFAMVFSDEAQAKEVADGLRTEDFESAVYTLTAEQISLKVTSDSAGCDLAERGFTQFPTYTQQVYDLIIAVDSGESTITDMKVELAALHDELVGIYNELESRIEAEGENEALSILAELYASSIEQMETVVNDNSVMATSISSNLKYLCVYMVCAYADMVGSI